MAVLMAMLMLIMMTMLMLIIMIILVILVYSPQGFCFIFHGFGSFWYTPHKVFVSFLLVW